MRLFVRKSETWPREDRGSGVGCGEQKRETTGEVADLEEYSGRCSVHLWLDEIVVPVLVADAGSMAHLKCSCLRPEHITQQRKRERDSLLNLF
ncbi:hybrid sensor histidine kinase/response regulator [Sesbania bispinosa]|nr:hybrid sensor histidine kinase/response regulator [Sesbania bispinosa]